MNIWIRKLPILLSIAGMTAKAIILVAWKLTLLSQPGWVISEPGGRWLAEHLTPLFFESRGVAPNIPEWWWAALLVIGFGIECFALGLLIRMAATWYKNGR